MRIHPFSLQLSAVSLSEGRSRRGFSFTEVLFAIMILGIGFIMIAGIFPVAISQTASTQEETIGASAARSAVAAYSSVPHLSDIAVVPAGAVTRLTDDEVMLTDGINRVRPWTLVKGNQILSDDPSFGWVALLKRDATDYSGQVPRTAQLIVIPVQIRGEATLTNADLMQNGAGNNASAGLMPLPVTVDLKDNSAANLADTCTVSGTFAGAAAPGAVIVLTNGYIYRLGESVNGSATEYQLLPGNDLGSTAEDVSGVNAFIVGRRPVGGSFEGPSIAIGAYVTYIALK